MVMRHLTCPRVLLVSKVANRPFCVIVFLFLCVERKNQVDSLE